MSDDVRATAKTFLGQSAYVSAVRVAAQVIQFSVFSYWAYINGFASAGQFSLNLNITLILAALGGAGLPVFYGRLAGPRIANQPFCHSLLLMLLGISGLVLFFLILVLLSLADFLSFDLYRYFPFLAIIIAWKDLAAESLNMKKNYFYAYGAERLVAVTMLLISFFVADSLFSKQLSYPIAFFCANLAGLLLLLYKSFKLSDFRVFRKLARSVAGAIFSDLSEYVRLGINNIVNMYTFPILLVTAGFFLAEDIIGKIAISHMFAAVVLYAQPAFINRLTPFLYENIYSKDQRLSWRKTIDRSVLIVMPGLLIAILLATSSILPLNEQGKLAEIIAISLAFIFGYLSRLVGSLNQLWLIHVQHLSSLWRWNILLLAIALSVILYLSESLSISYFVLIVALLEWCRSVIFSAWASLSEKI